MSDENVQQGQTPEATSDEQNKAWESPMLSRNSESQQAEGVPPAAPEDKPVEEKEAPKSEPEEKKDALSELRTKASNMNIMESFDSDPQFKPIAQYLDKQLEGVDTERAFGKALEYGKADLIDMAYLKEVLGDKAEEIVGLSTSLFEAAAAKATQAIDQVYTKFGGRGAVDQAVKFFNEKGDPNIRKVLGTLLDSGVTENIQYAMQQIVEFSKSAGGVVSKTPAVPLGQPSSERGLSSDEYREAIRKVYAKGIRGVRGQEELEKLEKSRLLGKQQGLA